MRLLKPWNHWKEFQARNRREIGMPKTFITERDIEDLAHQGTLELAVDDNTVLTDLAYEKAGRLGVKLLQANSQPPASPIRPYLSQPIDRPVSSGQAPDVLNIPVIHGGSELACCLGVSRVRQLPARNTRDVKV
jgi:hypothetical protein